MRVGYNMKVWVLTVSAYHRTKSCFAMLTPLTGGLQRASWQLGTEIQTT
jgi:hypothetical protein